MPSTALPASSALAVSSESVHADNRTSVNARPLTDTSFSTQALPFLTVLTCDVHVTHDHF